MGKVFISYSHEDKAVARQLAERLQSAGLDVWFDEFDLRPGDEIAAGIRSGFDQSTSVLILLSASSPGSSWARREAALAVSRLDKRVVPVLLDSRAEVPYLIRHISALNLSDPGRSDHQLARLIDLLKTQPSDATADLHARAEAASATATELAREDATYLRWSALLQRDLLYHFFGVSAAAIATLGVSLFAVEIGEKFEAVAKYSYVLLGVIVGVGANALLHYVKQRLAAHATRNREASREQA